MLISTNPESGNPNQTALSTIAPAEFFQTGADRLIYALQPPLVGQVSAWKYLV